MPVVATSLSEKGGNALEFDIDIDTVLARIAVAIVAAQDLAASINRGPGGREVALTITKLQEAEDWGKRAKWEMKELEA
jgi:hypothetical protein